METPSDREFASFAPLFEHPPNIPAIMEAIKARRGEDIRDSEEAYHHELIELNQMGGEDG